MNTMVVVLVVLGIVLFFFLNLAARELSRKIHEIREQAEREEALDESLRRDFTRESKTLKRVEIRNAKARILCVDDEEVILDGFRKILALDGYAVDTVETGQEALGLVQIHDYDFVFTDLKMPVMSGIEVTKSIKHMRPDIDVVIITGFATVESAVTCMQYGAMDYLEKPFSEQELRNFVKQALIKRRDRIEKQLKPRVHILGPNESDRSPGEEFSIPGGVLISSGHCWASIGDDGTANIGLDDYAAKLLGYVDSIEFPNIGMKVQAGEPLFSVNQGHRRAQFRAPLSGEVVRVNEDLAKDCTVLEAYPYGKNWVCAISGDDLDAELPRLKIGRSAVVLFQEDIDRFQDFLQKLRGAAVAVPEGLSIGAIRKLDDNDWDSAVKTFFGG